MRSISPRPKKAAHQAPSRHRLRQHWFSQLLCPICHETLTVTDGALQCPRHHSFDFAREGYVNLSPHRQGGDVKRMLLARRRFLDQGHYGPVSEAVNEVIATFFPRSLPTASRSCLVNILDVGCGEGYYLGRLQNRLRSQWTQGYLPIFGMDISKEAIRMAAKRYPHVCFFVADIKRSILMADQSVQVLLNIFAPRNPAEFARVITPQGLLAIVIPDPQHLQELRTAFDLLDLEADKPAHIRRQFAQQFALVEEQRLKFILHLETDALVQLVTMTPNYWHLSPETWEALGKIEPMPVTVGFTILLFQRFGNSPPHILS